MFDPKFSEKGWRVSEVVDTRTFDWMTGKVDPASGESIDCECCGREIVVHCHMVRRAMYPAENAGQIIDRAIIGTECAKRAKFHNGTVAVTNKSYWKHPNKVGRYGC